MFLLNRLPSAARTHDARVLPQIIYPTTTSPCLANTKPGPARARASPRQRSWGGIGDALSSASRLPCQPCYALIQ
eukprot:3996831-Pleurochrysis_carterae.AAC.1